MRVASRAIDWAARRRFDASARVCRMRITACWRTARVRSSRAACNFPDSHRGLCARARYHAAGPARHPRPEPRPRHRPLPRKDWDEDAAGADGLLRVFDETLPGEPLENVRFTQGDLVSLEPLVNRNASSCSLPRLQRELPRRVGAGAARERAAVRDALLRGSTTCTRPARRFVRLDDATRPRFCGRFGAQIRRVTVRAVDRRITNRRRRRRRTRTARRARRAASAAAAAEGVEGRSKNPAPPARTVHAAVVRWLQEGRQLLASPRGRGRGRGRKRSSLTYVRCLPSPAAPPFFFYDAGTDLVLWLGSATSRALPAARALGTLAARGGDLRSDDFYLPRWIVLWSTRARRAPPRRAPRVSSHARPPPHARARPAPSVRPRPRSPRETPGPLRNDRSRGRRR